MNARNTRIALGVLLFLLLSAIVAGVAVFFLFREARQPAPATFADLRDADFPGRFKMTDAAGRESFIVLYDDHTFMNEDGTTYPQYLWELSTNSLTITWQRTTTVFTRMEAPGLYLTAGTQGAPWRLQKQPPYSSRELALPAPLASIRFGAQCETNGLTPVHNGPGADGEIFPAKAGGEDCSQLARKPGKTDAYLYLQLTPSLREPPFTNALLLVEYFDRPSAVGRPGRLLIHYDDERGGPYAASQPLPLAGDDQWHEAMFYLATPLLQGRQNSGSDIRLVVNRSELPVRSVKLLTNVPIPEAKMPALMRR